MRDHIARVRTILIAVLLSTGCYVEAAPEGPPPTYGGRPPPPSAPDPSAAPIVGRLDFGGTVEGALPGDGAAVGYVTAAARGARVSITAGSSAAVQLFAYGPLRAPTGAGARPIARGPGRLAFAAPDDGTYLIAVQGPAGSYAPFTLSLACASGECRVECGPEGACPTGSQCAWVQCVRAPCPSYCQAMPQGTPDVPPIEPGGVGAVCGTRGAPPCGGDLYCAYPLSASCGETDAPGTCQMRAEVCTREYRPVCGCDGRTYGNACTAAAEGVSVRHEGECAPHSN